MTAKNDARSRMYYHHKHGALTRHIEDFRALLGALRARDVEAEDLLDELLEFAERFQAELIDHMRAEDEHLFPLALHHLGDTDTVETLREEHVRLQAVTEAFVAGLRAAEPESFDPASLEPSLEELQALFAAHDEREDAMIERLPDAVWDE